MVRVSDALHAAFEKHLLPVLHELGFDEVAPKSIKPGLVAVSASRAGYEAQLWCEAANGAHLHFRLDDSKGEVDLVNPWADPHEPEGTINLAVAQFMSHESAERLELAIEFVTGALVANFAKLQPALVDHPTIPRAEDLWKKRHQRGEVDEHESPATVVFSSASMVMVEAEGTRLTFRFDAKAFDKSKPVSVGGWLKNAAGSSVATKLMNGDRTWTFDLRGHPQSA